MPSFNHTWRWEDKDTGLVWLMRANSVNIHLHLVVYDIKHPYKVMCSVSIKWNEIPAMFHMFKDAEPPHYVDTVLFSKYIAVRNSIKTYSHGSGAVAFGSNETDLVYRSPFSKLGHSKCDYSSSSSSSITKCDWKKVEFAASARTAMSKLCKDMGCLDAMKGFMEGANGFPLQGEPVKPTPKKPKTPAFAMPKHVMEVLAW